MSQPIIDLTTKGGRVPVRIDGQEYAIRSVYNCDLTELQQAERASMRIAELLSAKTLTRAQQTDLGKQLDVVVNVALDAPAAVKAKLGLLNQMVIYRAFANTLNDAATVASILTGAPAIAKAKAPKSERRRRK